MRTVRSAALSILFVMTTTLGALAHAKMTASVPNDRDASTRLTTASV